MTTEIPAYALRAYALFYSKYGSREPFTQAALDWITGMSMKKKIFSVLKQAGWIQKKDWNKYICVRPEEAIAGLLEFKVPEIMKEATRPYAFTGLSAIEIWSDYVYVQRSRERSPYFMEVLRKDIQYWKNFFHWHSIPVYVEKGTSIGEFAIIVPQDKIESVQKEAISVVPLNKAMTMAKENEMYAYPYQYMKKKYKATESGTSEDGTAAA